MQESKRKPVTRLPMIVTLIGVLTLALLACTQPKPAAVTSVTIDQADQNLQVGDGINLTVSIATEGGADKTVTWGSSNDAVASINQGGRLEALAAGTTTITATSTFDSTKSDSINVTVTADPTDPTDPSNPTDPTDPSDPTPDPPVPAVTSVVINGGDRELALDTTFSFTANVAAEGGAAETVTWTSSNTGVATIDAGGTLQMLATGTTSITAISTFDPGREDSVTVTVYDAAVPLWTHQFGTAETDRARGATTDSDGNVIVVGQTSGAFPGSVNAGSSDAFIRKLTPAGEVLWTEQLGTSQLDGARVVTTDADNNIIVVIQTMGALILGEASIGGNDLYVLKLNTDGNHIWLKQFGSPAGDSVSGITIDSGNNIIITGHTGGNFARPVEGSHDAIVLKVRPNGEEAWRRQFGSDQQDMAHAVATDSEDNIIITGLTAGELPGTIEGSSSGSTDAFVQKLDADGDLLWARQFGSDAFDSATGVAIDSEDKIIITGETEGTLPGASTAGEADAFAYKLASDGTRLWTRQFGSDENDDAAGVTVDSQDNIIISGRTHGDFGGSRSGQFDGYTHKLDPAGVTIRTLQFGIAPDARVNVYGVTTDLHDNIIVFGDTDGSLGGESWLGGFDAFVRKLKP